MNKYKSRKDMLLATFPESSLQIMFDGDKDKISEFGNYLLELEELLNEDTDGVLYHNIYEDKIEKIRNKKCKTIEQMIDNMNKISKLEKKIDKNTKLSNKKMDYDLSIASYLNDKKYKKKFLDKNKYRKNMKNIAKAERKEMKEMKRLGYVTNNDVNRELSKLKLNDANKKMLNALTDAYEQKYFIN